MTTLIIERTGQVRALGNPLNLAGPSSAHRFSVILPVNPCKRAVFIALRRLFGDDGKVAAWTRTWRTTWEATILHTGEQARSNCRATLLAWEQEKFGQ